MQTLRKYISIEHFQIEFEHFEESWSKGWKIISRIEKKAIEI